MITYNIGDCLDFLTENSGILINASHKRFGGGYKNHSNAQEEYIFNKTSLKDLSPPENYYPVSLDRTDGFSLEVQDPKFRAIFMPALVWSKSKDTDVLEKRIINIFKLAEGLDNLIITPWGTGVFGCPRKIISELFNRHLEDFQGDITFVAPSWENWVKVK